MKTTINQTAKIIEQCNSIALFCHTQPDGDTIGSGVALYLALKKMGKDVSVFCDDNLGSKISLFPETSIISKTFSGKYDLYIAIDCGDIFRLGEFSGYFANFSNTLVIDHHISQPYGKYYCSVMYASTAEIVFDILSLLNVELDERIATLLYIGLSTDTGNFAHANTDEKVFDVARQLCKINIDIPYINRVFYKSISFERTKLIGKVLSRIRKYFDGKMCLIYTKQEDLIEFGLDNDASKNLVDYAINIDTAIVGISISERSENVFNVSMRGKDCDVRSVCERFGGGGHKLASGCLISGFFEDVVDKIVRAVGDKFIEEGISI